MGGRHLQALSSLQALQSLLIYTTSVLRAFIITLIRDVIGPTYHTLVALVREAKEKR